MTDTMVFPALLKYWRGVRGMSQLDLSLAAEVSARHLSFLETGRSKPSREMVLRLGATLGVPLREQNSLLEAAGFAPSFRGMESSDPLDPRLEQAISRMMELQEPYPLLVLDRHYDVLRANNATHRVFAGVLGDRAARLVDEQPLNALRLLFAPEWLRSGVEDWDGLARQVLIRLQREVLENPADERLAQLLDELVALPGVPDDWRTPDLGLISEPTLFFRVRCRGESISFLTTVTRFSAPQNVRLEELQIESYFPMDETTERVCRELCEG